MVLSAFRKYQDNSQAPMPDKKALEETAMRLQAQKLTPNEKVVEKGKAKATATSQSAVVDGTENKAHRSALSGEGGDQKPATNKPPAHAQPTKGTGDRFNGFVAYNGSECEKYRWAQTVDDLTIYVDLGGAYASKDIACNITKTTVSCSLVLCHVYPCLYEINNPLFLIRCVMNVLFCLTRTRPLY
jgi:hypothetical protein